MQAKRVLCHKEDGSAACSVLPALPTRCSDRMPPVMGRGGDECLGSSKLAVIIRCLHAFFSQQESTDVGMHGEEPGGLVHWTFVLLGCLVVMPLRRGFVRFEGNYSSFADSCGTAHPAAKR